MVLQSNVHEFLAKVIHTPLMLALMETWCPVGTSMKDASGSLTVNNFVSWLADSIDSIIPSRNLGSVEIDRKEGHMAAGVMYRLGANQGSCHSCAACLS